MSFRLSAWKCVVVVSANVALLLASAGCDRQPAPPLSTAAAAEVRPDEDTGKGPGYTYAISYPSLDPQWQALDKAIRGFAAVQKKDFLDASTADRGQEHRLRAGPEFHRRPPHRGFRQRHRVGFVLHRRRAWHADPRQLQLSISPTGKLNDPSRVVRGSANRPQRVSAECRRQLEGRYEAKLREIPAP